MVSAPPNGYLDVPTAWKARDKIANIIGVVVDFLPPTRTRGTDWVLTFTIIDSKWKEDLDVRGEGLKCRYFKPVFEKLPKVESKGDVVVLRHVKLAEWNGLPLAMSTHTSSWQIFSEKDIPNAPGNMISPKALAGTPTPSQDLVNYTIELCNDQDRTCLKASNPAQIDTSNPEPVDEGKPMSHASSVPGLQRAQARDKFRLIEDLTIPNPGEPLVFANLLGEVRKIYSDDFRVELSVSDYTSNKDLFNYSYDRSEAGRDGDEYAFIAPNAQPPWPGPWGRMTMVVTMWDCNAEFVRHSVKVGQYVFLRNVHIKQDNQGSRLEAALRADRRQPDQLGISIIKVTSVDDNEQLKDLLKRRREYEAKAKKKGRILLKDGISRERRLEQNSQESKAQSKSARKRSKKNKAKGRQVEDQAKIDGALAARLESNPHVARRHIDLRRISIDEILDTSILQVKSPRDNFYFLPFRNVSYQVKVRVLDFLPDKLVNFAAPYHVSDYNMLSADEASASETDGHDNSSETRWEWRFALLIEDAGPRPPNDHPKQQMILQVFGTDGDYLLNMEAEDLKTNPQALAKMREKLFVLWGDLEERKREDGPPHLESKSVQPSAKPFECLVKEYGAKRPRMQNASPLEQWERCFRMYGTTIM